MSLAKDGHLSLNASDDVRFRLFSGGSPMSLAQCKSCKAMVSTSARACPHCGAQRGLNRVLVWGLLIAVAVGASALTTVKDDARKPPVDTVAPSKPAGEVVKRDAIVAGELLGISPDYAPDVARMLNRLMAEHQPCQQDIQPVTASLDKDSSNPANPSFTVICGTPKKVLVHFSWMDSVNGTIPVQPAPPVSVTRSQASGDCEKAARQRAAQPSSVEFSRFWAAAFQERPDGTATFHTTFKASSAVGVQSEFEITCQFKGVSLTAAEVRPAG